jgi:hypothetical protein
MTSELPAYPAAVLAAIRAAEIDGRLPPPSAEQLGETFPFEPDVTVVPVGEPTFPEPPRPGEAGAEACPLCVAPDSDYLWIAARWRLKAWKNEGVHAFLLEPRAHVDLDGLTESDAVELGTLIVRVERAIRSSLEGVARVHVNRWGDGLAHLHWWFIARPAGLPQFRGAALPLWMDVLPPLPDAIWAADTARVAEALKAT